MTPRDVYQCRPGWESYDGFIDDLDYHILNSDLMIGVAKLVQCGDMDKVSLWCAKIVKIENSFMSPGVWDYLNQVKDYQVYRITIDMFANVMSEKLAN
jgi:hypothetical protein